MGAPVRLALVAAAAAAVVAAAPLAPPASAATPPPSSPRISVPIHAILSSPGRVLTLPDGRQLAATVYSVGPCAMEVSRPTGAAKNENATSPYTALRQNRGLPCTLADWGGRRTFVGSQAVLVTANGFPFSPTFALEDVDAATRQPEVVSTGWREAATALGIAGGALVRPTIALASQTLVGVVQVGVAVTSLAQVGWGTAAVAEGAPPDGAVLIETLAYKSWTQVQNIKDDNAFLARGDFSFPAPLDSLLLMYALMQPETDRQWARTASFVSALNLPSGCQCATGSPVGRWVSLPVEGSPGRCTRVWRSVAAASCDLLGKRWCTTTEARRWVATSGVGADGTISCDAEDTTIQRDVAEYAPLANFRAPPETAL